MAERSTRTGTAGATSADVSAQAEKASAEASQAAHSAGDVIRAGTDQAVDDARAMVRDMADRQRQRAAQSLGGMASALHKSARDLEKESGTMARYTDMAADRLDEAATYLRSADWQEIVNGAEGFARRQPYWFIGGAVAAGFVLARFLKSSGGEGPREGMGGATGRGGSAYAPGGTVTGGYGASAPAQPYASPAAATTTTGDLT